MSKPMVSHIEGTAQLSEWLNFFDAAKNDDVKDVY